MGARVTARDIYANAVRAGADGALAETGRDPGDPAAWETSVAVLQRDAHVAYLRKSLHHLSAGHVVLDASRCWLCYWIVHALALLGESLPPDLADDVVEFLALCQHPDGGFGGGPGQMPHLAPTYAATACLDAEPLREPSPPSTASPCFGSFTRATTTPRVAIACTRAARRTRGGVTPRSPSRISPV